MYFKVNLTICWRSVIKNNLKYISLRIVNLSDTHKKNILRLMLHFLELGNSRREKLRYQKLRMNWMDHSHSKILSVQETVKRQESSLGFGIAIVLPFKIEQITLNDMWKTERTWALNMKPHKYCQMWVSLEILRKWRGYFVPRN